MGEATRGGSVKMIAHAIVTFVFAVVLVATVVGIVMTFR